jgi:hypothetical protein
MGEFVSEMRWERRDGGMFVVLGGGGCSRRHDNTCLIIASLSTGVSQLALAQVTGTQLLLMHESFITVPMVLVYSVL